MSVTVCVLSTYVKNTKKQISKNVIVRPNMLKAISATWLMITSPRKLEKKREMSVENAMW